MPNVLFVCTANRCRSPLSAALLRHRLQETGHDPADWHIASAGVWTRAGQPATRTAREVAAELGLDLSMHRSREVTAGLLRSADLVVVMEHTQCEAVALEWPWGRERISRFSELVGEHWDVRDPRHRDIESVRETAAVLNWLTARSLPTLISTLLKRAEPSGTTLCEAS